MTLARERCQPCQPGTPPMAPEEAAALAPQLDPAWELVGGNRALRRTYDTRSFGHSMALAVRIGFLAESQGHHPDLTVSWGRLVVELTTHAAGGLTRNDFILAAKIDRALAGQ